MKNRIKRLWFMLALAGLTTFAACEKEYIVEQEKEDNYYYPHTEKRTDTLHNPTLSQLKDSVIKWNAEGTFKNCIIPEAVLIDSARYIGFVFNPNDNVHWNALTTGIEEIHKSARIPETADILIPNGLHVTNTKAFNAAYFPPNYEINQTIVEPGTYVSTDTFNIEAAQFAEDKGVQFTLDPTTTIMDVSNATISSEEWAELYATGGGNYPDYAIAPPTELGHIAANDTIPFIQARHTFLLDGQTTYFNGSGAFISTTINPAYPPAAVKAILGNLPGQIEDVTFLFLDGTHIPAEYYNSGK